MKAVEIAIEQGAKAFIALIGIDPAMEQAGRCGSLWCFQGPRGTWYLSGYRPGTTLEYAGRMADVLSCEPRRLITITADELAEIPAAALTARDLDPINIGGPHAWMWFVRIKPGRRWP